MQGGVSVATSQRFAWLSEKERAKRNRVWLEWPVATRKVFRHEQALRVRAIGERRATEIAWDVASRVDAWRRRGGDSKPCSRCKALVLWRHEHGGRVATDPNGQIHACG